MPEKMTEQVPRRFEDAPNTPGWSWFFTPINTSCLASGGGDPPVPFVAMIDSDEAGIVTVYFACTGSAANNKAYAYQAIAFDENTKAYPLKQNSAGSSGYKGLGIAMYRFGGSSDDEAPSANQVLYIGIEFRKKPE